VAAVWASGLLAAGAAAALLIAISGEDGRALVVRDEHGGELVKAELPATGHFALAYRHSYYKAPGRELFTAAGDRLRLRALASPSAAVLDYYATSGERTRRGRWLRLSPASGPSYERLPLIATATGRRTLLVAGERYPLYGREARHLTIEVEG
jgi:hypothetical protein